MELTIAESILMTPDRTPKERRDMAEIRNVSPVDWNGGTEVCRFHDGSELMMVFDGDLCPVEFLPILPPEVEAERAELVEYARTLADIWRHLGPDEMLEQIEAHIESNYPDADERVVSLIVATIH